MQTIMIYGQLGQQFGRVHRYEVNSPAEAVRALCATVKGFKQYLLKNGSYRVLVGGREDVADEILLHYPVSERESIRIIPVVSGASGFGRILLGVALVGFAMVFPGPLASLAMSAGKSLILSGVAQLLFTPQQSQQEIAERPENRPSFFFNGAVNTTRQGNAVPVCYGRMVVGSQVISSGLSVEQI
ncbi:MAG: tail assembly protein [Gammaproteobacteria bacterium]|nr:tail assembly protein [Gammaproteobacteria bacterium]